MTENDVGKTVSDYRFPHNDCNNKINKCMFVPNWCVSKAVTCGGDIACSAGQRWSPI